MKIIRFSTNPIIYPELHPSLGTNINGPSLIRVPDWVEQPLGRYYLYFAHHRDTYIRLAYADALEGPWTVYVPGCLHLEETVCTDHIASPDVHVDIAREEIRMYFHGIYDKQQLSFVATSRDGVNFQAFPEVLGPFYFRVFFHAGWHYAIAKNRNIDGVLLRSRDGLSRFEQGPHFFPGMRHVAVRKHSERLQIFLTRVGDTPERILLSYLSLEGNWMSWCCSEPVTLLEPEMAYEGATLPLAPSSYGAVHIPVRQLRDPAIYEEENHAYLLYSVAGERGIAIAEILD